MPRSITKSIRAARRADAEARQAVYEEYTLQERLDRAMGAKERAKLTKRIEKQQRDKR